MLIHQVLNDILKRRWGKDGTVEYVMSGTTGNADINVKIVVHIQTLTFNMPRYTVGRYDSVYDVLTEMMADYLERIEIEIDDKDNKRNISIEPELSNELGEVWWGSWKAVLNSDGEVMLVDKKTVMRIIFGTIIEDPVRIVDALTELWIPIDRKFITELMEKGCEHVSGVDMCYELKMGSAARIYMLGINGEIYMVQFTRNMDGPRWIAYIYEPKWIKRIDL